VTQEEQTREYFEPTEIKLGMTRAQAYEFVRKLAQDPDFRVALETEPLKVLAREGIGIWPPDRVPSTLTLPPPEEVQVALDRMGEPDAFGNVNPDALGYACYAAFARLGFAMPLIAPRIERDGAR
jgi:hypothetical protein